MFRYKINFILILILNLAALTAPAAEEVAPLRPALNRSYTLAYTTWVEEMDIDNGVIDVKDIAQFIGMGIGYSREKFGRNSWGQLAEASLMFGQANGGGTQTLLTYQKVHQSWVGGQASLRMAYRLSPTITLSLGPTLLVRQITWPTETPGLTVTSGTTANMGALADLKFFLNDHWELRQSIGTLAFKASTLWSFSAGYHY
jgi:hypothetical protein